MNYSYLGARDGLGVCVCVQASERQDLLFPFRLSQSFINSCLPLVITANMSDGLWLFIDRTRIGKESVCWGREPEISHTSILKGPPLDRATDLINNVPGRMHPLSRLYPLTTHADNNGNLIRVPGPDMSLSPSGRLDYN